MQKRYPSLIVLLSLIAAPLFISAQCTNWLNPTDSTGWIDFNDTFGGAPCDSGVGCPINEINAFEIYADEAYAMDNFLAGGTYMFSACNGVGGMAWDIEYTIIAPSGNVDASGLDSGSICALTFTASENGTYLIVISEVGACGTSSNNATNNGFPSITCISGADCNSIGINEVTEIPQINIYPNPSTGLYNMALDVSTDAIRILDVNGRVVEDVNVRNDNGVISFDLRGKESGTYIVQVVAQGVQLAQRITLVD